MKVFLSINNNKTGVLHFYLNAVFCKPNSGLLALSTEDVLGQTELSCGEHLAHYGMFSSIRISTH